MSDRVTINVDGRELQVPAGSLLIEAAQDEGVYIPRFCWHKRMKPVGMCRMCLVEIEGPRGKLLTTSCTVRVNDGMVVDTRSDVVKKAQEGVLEFLLINHPLDCPVCDRGGECPLQDQTMAYGPGESRFVEEKRHFEKPIDISELVKLDRERCILCARCTRFSDEISGDPLIEFVDRGYGTQVLTFPDEPFASYFSGNTVQICPVGALTATPYRFRARPWDLEAVESTCLTCSVGCRVSLQSSQNVVIRLNGVDNDATNHGWLCDKGRFTFEYLASPERITSPLVKQADGTFAEATWGEALELVAAKLRGLDGGRIGALGGARATNEEAYAFGKFVRMTLGSAHLDAQLGDGLDPRLAVGVTPRATMPDLERAKAILVWGPDLKEELPVLYLRVRRAAQELGAELVVVHPRRTGLDDVATHKVTYRPGQGPAVLRRLATGDGNLAEARAALAAGPVVALVGRPGLAEDPRLAEAVAAFAASLPEAGIMPLVRRGNVMGALDMGLSPALLPGRVAVDDESGRAALAESWGGELPGVEGMDAAAILAAGAGGGLDALLLFGADPADDFPGGQLADAALDATPFVVAFDLFRTDSSRQADVILPVAGFGETEGTVTNVEGRVQKVNRLVLAPGRARPSWSVLEDLAGRLGGSIGAVSAEALAKEIADVAPAYGGITWDLLDFGDGREGVVVPGPDGAQPLQHAPADPALQPQARDLVLHLARVLYDDGVHVRFGPSLARVVPVAAAHLHPSDAKRLGLEPGSLVTVSGAGGEIDLPLSLDASLEAGTVYVPFNLDETTELGNALEVTVHSASPPAPSATEGGG